MSSTPKWYCRNKSQPMQTFVELFKLGQDLRRITKRLVIDVKVDIYSEHVSCLLSVDLTSPVCCMLGILVSF